MEKVLSDILACSGLVVMTTRWLGILTVAPSTSAKKALFVGDLVYPVTFIGLKDCF